MLSRMITDYRTTEAVPVRSEGALLRTGRLTSHGEVLLCECSIFDTGSAQAELESHSVLAPSSDARSP